MHTRISAKKKASHELFSFKEIEQNDSNLNVTLYVMQDEENEGINIAQEYAELKELEKQRQEVANKLEQYISELTKQWVT